MQKRKCGYLICASTHPLVPSEQVGMRTDMLTFSSPYVSLYTDANPLRHL